MRRNATASVMAISVKVGGHGTIAGNHRPSLGGVKPSVDVFKGRDLCRMRPAAILICDRRVWGLVLLDLTAWSWCFDESHP